MLVYLEAFTMGLDTQLPSQCRIKLAAKEIYILYDYNRYFSRYLLIDSFVTGVNI